MTEIAQRNTFDWMIEPEWIKILILLFYFIFPGISVETSSNAAVTPIHDGNKAANISAVTPANEIMRKLASSETEIEMTMSVATTTSTSNEHIKNDNSSETHLHIVSQTSTEKSLSSSSSGEEISLSVTTSSSKGNDDESLTMNPPSSIDGRPLIVLSPLPSSQSSETASTHNNNNPTNIDLLKSEESSLFSHNDDDSLSSNERKSFDVIRGRALDLSSSSLMNPDAEKTSKIVYVTAPPNATMIPTVRPKAKSLDDLSDVSMDDIDFDSFDIGRNSEGTTDNDEGSSKKQCSKVSN